MANEWVMIFGNKVKGSFFDEEREDIEWAMAPYRLALAGKLDPEQTAMMMKLSAMDGDGN